MVICEITEPSLRDYAMEQLVALTNRFSDSEGFGSVAKNLVGLAIQALHEITCCGGAPI